MPINGERQPFQTGTINKAHDGRGVYQLLSNGRPIFIGWADPEGVKDKLREHYTGKHGTCTQIATGFIYEEHDEPRARCQELLEEHEQEFGTLPRCNL